MPKNKTNKRSISRKLSAATFPTFEPTLSIRTVMILSIITWDSFFKWLVGLGCKENLKKGASTKELVIGKTVRLSCLENKSDWITKAGLGFP